jgi:hypothetical protein
MQKSHNGLDIKSKLWIELAGEPLVGPRQEILAPGHGWVRFY